MCVGGYARVCGGGLSIIPSCEDRWRVQLEALEPVYVAGKKKNGDRRREASHKPDQSHRPDRTLSCSYTGTRCDPAGPGPAGTPGLNIWGWGEEGRPQRLSDFSLLLLLHEPLG